MCINGFERVPLPWKTVEVRGQLAWVGFFPSIMWFGEMEVKSSLAAWTFTH